MATRPKVMAVQGAAVLVGAAFLVAGILWVHPRHNDRLSTLLEWAGRHSGAKLFGVFAVSGLHNVVHLAFGVAGLLMARTYAASRAYLLVGGLVYLGLWVYGSLIDHASTGQLRPAQRRGQLAAPGTRRGHGAARRDAGRHARPDEAQEEAQG